MTERHMTTSIRRRQLLRELEDIAIPLIKSFDVLIRHLEAEHSVKTDHASTFRNLREAAIKEIDGLILELHQSV